MSWSCCASTRVSDFCAEFRGGGLLLQDKLWAIPTRNSLNDECMIQSKHLFLAVNVLGWR